MASPTRQYHRAERQATVTEAVHVELRQTGGEIDGDLQNVEHRHVGGGELTERRSRRQARHQGCPGGQVEQLHERCNGPVSGELHHLRLGSQMLAHQRCR
jgi:hypothetical protein